MTITCPHCQYQREIDPMSVPANVARVLCPTCNQRFSWPPQEAVAAKPVVRPRIEKTAFPPRRLPQTAGFGLRLVAQLIDGLVYSLLTFILAVGLYLIIGFFGGDNTRALSMMGVLAIFVVIASSWLYSVFFIGYCGQTPGKMVTRIKVVSRNGGEIGFGTAIFRELVGKFISTLLFGCGYLMVLFDEKNQGLHDKIADTWVIKL